MTTPAPPPSYCFLPYRCWAEFFWTASGSFPCNDQGFLLSLRQRCKREAFWSWSTWFSFISRNLPSVCCPGWELWLVIDSSLHSASLVLPHQGPEPAEVGSPPQNRRGREIWGGLLIFADLFTEVVTPPKLWLLSWNLQLISKFYFWCLPPNFVKIWANNEGKILSSNWWNSHQAWMPFANKITKGCSIFLELLFQAKNLLARNLTVSSPCTLMMCTVHLLQDRMASSTGRSWLSLSCDLGWGTACTGCKMCHFM